MKIKMKFFVFFILICLNSLMFSMENNFNGNPTNKQEGLNLQGQKQNARISIQDESNDHAAMEIDDLPENVKILYGFRDLPAELKQLIFQNLIRYSISLELNCKLLDCISDFFKKQEIDYFECDYNKKQILNFLISKWGFYKLFTVNLPNFLDLNLIFNDPDFEDNILGNSKVVKMSFDEINNVYKKLVSLGLEKIGVEKKWNHDNFNKLVLELGWIIDYSDLNVLQKTWIKSIKSEIENLILNSWGSK